VKKERQIIGLSGKSQSGKDTVANILKNKFGFHLISFADAVKELCSESFDIPIEYFYKTELKDCTDNFIIVGRESSVSKMISIFRSYGYRISNKKKKELLHLVVDSVFNSPRDLMTKIGHDVCRKVVDDDIWLNVAMKKVSKLDGSVVIPDCRFLKEILIIKQKGGIVGIVKRPNNVNNNSEGHVSENIVTFDYDLEFLNDTNLAQFQWQIEMWFKLRT